MGTGGCAAQRDGDIPWSLQNEIRTFHSHCRQHEDVPWSLQLDEDIPWLLPLAAEMHSGKACGPEVEPEGASLALRWKIFLS